MCRSNRVRTKTEEPYIPSMKGSKYEVALAQYVEHGMLHPDAHMLFNTESVALWVFTFNVKKSENFIS